MLPDRHIHVDAARLQAIFDAERDRHCFNRLRAALREARAEGDASLASALGVLALATVAATLIVTIAGGA